MFHNFAEIESFILARKVNLRVVLANAQDSKSLAALVMAKKKGIASGILLGNGAKIRAILEEMQEPAGDYEIVEVPEGDDEACAHLAIEMVHSGRADLPMKGLMQNSAYMRAILNKTTGLLPEGALLSQATVLEYPEENRFIIISDCAVNIAPTYEEKVKITQNAVIMAEVLGISQPKVAIVTPLEVVNPKIQSTVDAQLLVEAYRRGEITNCIVGGPFALDNAISVEAAHHKGVSDPVAGVADILIMPELATGNVFTKSLIFFARMSIAGVIIGTTIPVINTSRTDALVNKYYAILTTFLMTLKLK